MISLGGPKPTGSADPGRMPFFKDSQLFVSMIDRT